MKEKINKEFEEAFKKYKEELRFKASLKDLDEIFLLRDYFQKEGYVSNNISRQVARRIVDLYNSWLGYMHGLVMPNPSSMFSVSESEMFEDPEKEDIIKTMNKALELTSRNSLIDLKKDKKMDGEYVDYAVDFWKNEFKPKLINIMSKINSNWKQKSEE